MMDLGAMPVLKGLVEGGCSGVLRSTVPAQTPAAWTTFMTGVHPGTHGIINWQDFDACHMVTRLNNVERYKGKTFYEHFSRAGLKVGVVMQPTTYPPFEVNGFLLTGFDSPGTSAAFAHPPKLQKEILDICPDHDRNLDVNRDWDVTGHETDDDAFENNIDLFRKRVHRVADLSIELNRRHPTDVLMVYFQDPDLLLHRAWKWLDPKSSDVAPRRHARVVEFFRDLDRACDKLLKATEAPGRLVLAMSDHGQQADRLRVQPNNILMEMGFLVPARGLALVRDAQRRLQDRINKVKRKGVGVPIDWDKTRAYMPFQACTGFIYVNLKGRQPFGSVAPEDYESVRDAVVERLRDYRDPNNGNESYFEEVVPTDGLFKRKDQLRLPDIYIQPKPGIEFVRRAKGDRVAYPSKRTYAGLHHPDGIYFLSGDGVARKRDCHAHIADLAPTLMACMGQLVPGYMEGRVLSEGFVEAPAITTQPIPWDALDDTGDAYTEEQEAAIEERLSELGYLD
jgi:predicted AlkP superfamily phosphohydrolase/phosphomutase